MENKDLIEKMYDFLDQKCKYQIDVESITKIELTDYDGEISEGIFTTIGEHYIVSCEVNQYDRFGVHKGTESKECVVNAGVFNRWLNSEDVIRWVK